MNGSTGGHLQNVLSISTAASNRYLLHFNSLNSLTQWTAGIRLAMYEHATLHEAYTGSLIAGKGKLLNNIRSIMEKTRFKNEDWARVRFGAGTPWRRCWCVISPPDEKEVAKAQKELKKRNNYDRKRPMPKGDIKFYDTRRITKKTQPIATISDAYAAYAIYPESKPLVDQSTLVKLEGLITIHSQPESTSEGFLFVMPEVHPAVTGFEMMLRWLFPVWDAFGLYGRPTRLIADTLDQRGLMFAMPRDRRYGYLDTLDVSGLIHTEGSQAWNERQWRSELKKLTSHRMTAADSDPSPLRKRRNTTSRTSLPGMIRGGVKFDDDQAPQSSPVSRKGSPTPPSYDESGLQLQAPRRAMAASVNGNGHRRSVSEAMNYKRYQTDTPSRLSIDSTRDDYDQPPRPPTHGVLYSRNGQPPLERVNSEREEVPTKAFDELHINTETQPLEPVASPPAFTHNPSSKPLIPPVQAPELRRATSGMDDATLHQMRDAVQPPELLDNGAGHAGDRSPNEVYIDAVSYPRVLQADASIRKDLVNQPRPHRLLPTIPASPMSQDPTIDPLHNAVPPPSQPSLSAPATAAPIPRKPISPGAAPVTGPILASALPVGDIVSPPSPSHSSIDGTSDQLIDGDALEQILKIDRFPTMNSHEPNHASTQSSDSKPKEQDVVKPRAGRLKVVGDSVPAEGTMGNNPGNDPSLVGAMPTIDFGPTYAHKPTYGQSPRDSPTRPSIAANTSPSRSPASPGKPSFYSGGKTSPSFNQGNLPTPTDSGGSADPRRRSLVWQPAAAQAETETRQTLTPEQWVQHRASIASQPMALRSTPNLSAERPTKLTKRHSSSGVTPPTSRQTSGDWTQQARKSPPQSQSRPTSRNAGFYLQNNGSKILLDPSQPANLTAREQMSMARATGAPLVNLDQANPRRRPSPQDPNAGLYGALTAHEYEKTQVREGYRSNTVQQAINVKQQQQQQAQDMQYRMQQQYSQQAAQAAYNAQMQQQAAQSRAMGVQRPQYQQQMQMQQGQQWTRGGPNMQAYDPRGQGMRPWQGQQQPSPPPNQHGQRNGTYTGQALPNFTRAAPR